MKSKLNKNKEIKRQKKKANKNHAIYSAIYLSRSSLQFDLELWYWIFSFVATKMDLPLSPNGLTLTDELVRYELGNKFKNNSLKCCGIRVKTNQCYIFRFLNLLTWLSHGIWVSGLWRKRWVSSEVSSLYNAMIIPWLKGPTMQLIYDF